MTFYHFTCRDSKPGIIDTGILVPQWQPLLGLNLVWMTDLEKVDRYGLGLTKRHLTCDRSEHRFRIVDPDEVVPWSEIRQKHRPTIAYMLEKGAKPEHWFVSTKPQKAVLDE